MLDAVWRTRSEPLDACVTTPMVFAGELVSVSGNGRQIRIKSNVMVDAASLII